MPRCASRSRAASIASGLRRRTTAAASGRRNPMASQSPSRHAGASSLPRQAMKLRILVQPTPSVSCIPIRMSLSSALFPPIFFAPLSLMIFTPPPGTSVPARFPAICSPLSAGRTAAQKTASPSPHGENGRLPAIPDAMRMRPSARRFRGAASKSYSAQTMLVSFCTFPANRVLSARTPGFPRCRTGSARL